MTLDKREPKTLEEAKQRYAEVREAANQVILIMTAESALLAQKVVREAGRR